MRYSQLAPVAILGTFLAACSSSSTGPNGNGVASVRLSLASASAVAGSGPAASETFELGGNTLVLDRVQLVLREIELKRTRDSADCPGTGSGDDSGSGSDDCEELEFGPVLFDVPLNGVAARQITVNADTGTFREVEFDIHKPEDNSQDSAFLTEHPEFRQVSIWVEGTYNGTRFNYLSDLNVEVELDMFPPLQIIGGTTVDLTLVVDLATWFLNTTGTSLVDPAQANKGGQFEGLVKENIKRSFEMIEEDN